jgi:hypothetical protein
VSTLTRFALPGIIVLSGLGALLVSLLIVRYGFPTGDEDPEESNRRLIITRFGHAAAAVCFAASAILAVVALPARAPAPVTSAAGGADPTQVAQLAADVHRLEERLDDQLAAFERRLSQAQAMAAERRMAEPRPAAEPPAAQAAPARVTPPVARMPPAVEPPAVTEPSPAPPPPAPRASRPPRRPMAPPMSAPPFGDEAAAALPGEARLHQLRATIRSVHVDVRSRPGPGGTEWVVHLTDVAGRPLTGADVVLHGRTAGGAAVEVALPPAAEPGAYRVRLPGRRGAPDDLRLRVVRHDKRFDLSLGQEVSW